MRFAAALVLALSGVEGLAGCATSSAPAPRSFECRWAEAPIAIDGRLDEWAPSIVFDVPWEGRAAATSTRAQLLWDREFLYFAGAMEDAEIKALPREHDGRLWDNDVFELFFRPGADKYYEFQVDAAGKILDMQLPGKGGGYDQCKADGDFHVEAVVRRRPGGWDVEGRIPWRDFARTGGRPEPGAAWGVNLSRYDYTGEAFELSSAAPLAQPSFHRVEEYATLRFLPSERHARLRERHPPLTTSRVIGSPDPPAPYRVRKIRPGLELKKPIAVLAIPGSDDLLLLDQSRSWGQDGRLLRVRGETTEVLRTFKGDAYDLCFDARGFLYVGWNGDKKTRVSRFKFWDPASETTVIEWDSGGHNGGALAFDAAGLLYVTSGDGTSDSDTNVVGQRLDNLLGKVLRIDVRELPYKVPPDNPFVDRPGARPETWAYGLRNPWRMSIDAQGRVWVGNNGQDLWEQVFRVSKGANYGWSATEGSHPFYPARAGADPIAKPAFEHSHAESRSLTGGRVYRGALDELRGKYVYGDYSTGKIWAEGREIADTALQITYFGEDAAGEMIVVDHAGGLYHFERTPVLERPEFPRKLSETGLFRDGKPVPSLVPYTVNAPLWSDGAEKERFLAVPAGGKIEFGTSRGWAFDNGATLVKTFKRDGRLLETRFLTRQDGEWAGYTYVWNAAQTDAELLGAEGLDRDGWHFPSRAECMVCHSRAANYVLGASAAQLRELDVLEGLGFFKANWGAQAVDDLKADARAKGLEGKALDAHVKKHQGGGTSSLLPKASYPALADPYDATKPLEARARAYLASNCAHCHVEAGGGNAAIDLEHTTELAKTRTLDVAPLHPVFDLQGARIIAPGKPESSTLLERLKRRGPGQMPPLATSRVDAKAVELLEAWIRGLR
ncbi:MAG TPA: PQQ-dependent sugar dehydrogenase [Planctomycetota bacterium]